MAEQYVFDTETIAIDAENYICTVAGCPIVNKNALTGLPDPNVQKTESYAIPQQRITDGKWFFTRVPQYIREQYPPEVQEQFNYNYPHVIENFTYSWVTDNLEP